MKPGFFPARRNSLWWMPLMFVAIMLTCLYSCKNKAKEKGTDGSETPGLAADATCYTLTKKQIEDVWIKGGYTTSPNPKNNIEYFQLFVYQKPGQTNFEVNMQAYDSTGAAIGRTVPLAAGAGCTVSLPPGLLIGKIYVDLGKLKFLKDPRTIADNFVRIVFTPAVYSYNGLDLLKFDATAFFETSTDGLDPALPCPPCINCRPPCPTNCTPACTGGEMDSLANLDSAGIRSLDTTNLRR